METLNWCKYTEHSGFGWLLSTDKVAVKFFFKVILSFLLILVEVQFSSVAQSCPTLCDPMNCSTPGFPVHHQLPEFTQTHIHWGFPGGSDCKASACNAGDLGSIPGLGRSPGEGNGNPLQYSHGWRSLVGYRPWGHKELDTTE